MFAQRRNHLKTHFSERILVVKRSMTLVCYIGNKISQKKKIHLKIGDRKTFIFSRIQTLSVVHINTVYRVAGSLLLLPTAHLSHKSKGEVESMWIWTPTSRYVRMSSSKSDLCLTTNCRSGELLLHLITFNCIHTHSRYESSGRKIGASHRCGVLCGEVCWTDLSTQNAIHTAVQLTFPHRKPYILQSNLHLHTERHTYCSPTYIST